MPGKASLCFYHLQNEEGETAGRPNAYRLPIAQGKAPTLQDVHESFPLHGLGTFHFRFRVPVGDSHAYLDVLEPDQEVPTLGGNVHAKVLRLDKAKCVLPKGSGLTLRSGGAMTATSGPSAAASPPPQASPRPGTPHAAGTPPPATQAPAPAVPEEDYELYAAEVPAEHKGKPRSVQIAIVKRLRAEAASAAAAVGAVGAAQAAAAAHLQELDASRQKLEAEVKAWGYDAAGEVRNIRALLSNLGKILWEEAKPQWKGVSMSALVDAKKVRIPYFKACRIVHPDKNRDTNPDQEYIASEVFQALNKAWATFEEKELQ